MAISDIITRIGADAEQESDEAVKAAEQEAERLVAEARAAAAEAGRRSIESARARAAADSDTVRANARLAARDRVLALKRELLADALGRVEERLAALPDDRYAVFLASAIASSARAGDTVRLAPADSGRKAALKAAVEKAAPGVALTWSDEPAPVSRGAVIDGDRVSSDLSLAALVAAEKERLSARIADVLFAGETGEGA